MFANQIPTEHSWYNENIESMAGAIKCYEQNATREGKTLNGENKVI